MAPGEVKRVQRGSLPVPPRKKRDYRTPDAPNERVREARVSTGAGAKNALPLMRMRGLDARGRARASFRVVAEVDSWLFWRREAGASTSPDLEAFMDGRLAPQSCVRKHAGARAKGHRRCFKAETLT